MDSEIPAVAVTGFSSRTGISSHTRDAVSAGIVTIAALTTACRTSAQGIQRMTSVVAAFAKTLAPCNYGISGHTGIAISASRITACTLTTAERTGGSSD